MLERAPQRNPGGFAAYPLVAEAHAAFTYNQCKIWLRNSFVRSCCGCEKNSFGSFI